MRDHRVAMAGALTVVLLAGGCAGDGSGTTPVEAVGQTRVASQPESCTDVSDDLVDAIAVGARPGDGFDVVSARAVRDRPGVFVVAARLREPVDGRSKAVWTAVSLDARQAAPFLVADVAAGKLTTWSSVEEFPQYGVPLDSPSISAARRCV